MRKYYIVENRIRYEEIETEDGTKLLRSIENTRPGSSLRLIEGRLWYLVQAERSAAYFPAGEAYPHRRYSVYKRNSSGTTDEVIGEVCLPDDFGNREYFCYWKPVTTNILHFSE